MCQRATLGWGWTLNSNVSPFSGRCSMWPLGWALTPHNGSDSMAVVPGHPFHTHVSLGAGRTSVPSLEEEIDFLADVLARQDATRPHALQDGKPRSKCYFQSVKSCSGLSWGADGAGNHIQGSCLSLAGQDRTTVPAWSRQVLRSPALGGGCCPSPCRDVPCLPRSWP